MVDNKMGIKDLSKLYDIAPGAQGTITIDKFRGRRIAFDAGTWMSASWSSACKEYIETHDILETEIDHQKIVGYWIHRLQLFVNQFLNLDITPVFVLDGKAPEDKTGTKVKRRETDRKNRQKYEEHRDMLLDTDPLLRTTEATNKLATLMKNAKMIPYPDPSLLPGILSGAGIPCLQCKEEAERLCTALAREGWVSAVYSTDTDNLVHGCPLLLTELKSSTFKYVSLPILLSGLGLTREQFVDVCITAGCDYNTNMPRIGIKRGYDLVRNHGSIENYPEKYDISCLRHAHCRELFAPKSSQELTDDPISLETLSINKDIFEFGSRDILESYGAEGWIQNLVSYFPMMSQPKKNLPAIQVRTIKIRVV